MSCLTFRKWYSGIVFVLLFLSTNGSAEPVEILTFSYPPILTTADSGIIPQIISESASEAGLTTKLVVFPRKRALKMFEHGEFHLFLGESRYFPDIKSSLRVQKLLFARVVFVYLKSRYRTFNFNDDAALREKVFGVSLGSNLIPGFEKKGWTVETVKKLEYNIKKLYNNRIDFWGTVDVTAIDLIKKYYPENQHDFSMWEVEKFSIELLSKKGSPLEPSFIKLQSGFEEIVKNGRYKKILEGFYGMGEVPVSVMVQ